MRISSRRFFALTGFLLSAFSGLALAAGEVVFSASGADPAAIQSTVDSFRAALGTLNPNVAGSFGSGRREINWDGVPNALAAPNNLPANFFNSNSPRGAEFVTPGTGFQVSANAGVAPVRFDNLNPTYSATFQVFSAQRLFTALGSNVVDVLFFVPGTPTKALIDGFGAVFTDADAANTSSLELFDSGNASLGKFFVPASPSGGLSFLGITLATTSIARVRITSGNVALGPNDDGAQNDAVAMDDFIYAEPIAAPPQAVPSLSLWGLMLVTLLLGVWTMVVLRRRVAR
jgi:hypothetical protein